MNSMLEIRKMHCPIIPRGNSVNKILNTGPSGDGSCSVSSPNKMKSSKKSKPLSDPY